MSIREDLEKHRGKPAEQRMVILRRELLRPIVTVRTSAHLLQQSGTDIAQCLPDAKDREELLNAVKWLAEAAKDLEEILDALTEDVSQVKEQHGAE